MFDITTHNGLRALRRALIALVTVLVPVCALGSAPPALAELHHPKGIYAPFADCPLSNPEVNSCVYGTTESGEFVLAKSKVPIKATVTLQGGLHQNADESLSFVGAEDGNTLSKTPQVVPGGLAGLFNCYEITNFLERIACEVVFQNGVTGVNATTELAAPASSIGISLLNLILAHETALSLPVKVHLENPFLGSSCYVGSNAHPIVIPLTTGTTSPPPPNKPITGNPGTFEFAEEGKYLKVRENSLVNNSFAAPRAEGCGGLFAFLIDPLIDAKIGLPAAAGLNTAILNGTLQSAAAAAVKASE